MKVYVVYYLSALDNCCHMWAIYRTKEAADKEVEELHKDDCSAWWFEETVQE